MLDLCSVYTRYSASLWDGGTQCRHWYNRCSSKIMEEALRVFFQNNEQVMYYANTIVIMQLLMQLLMQLFACLRQLLDMQRQSRVRRMTRLPTFIKRQSENFLRDLILLILGVVESGKCQSRPMKYFQTWLIMQEAQQVGSQVSFLSGLTTLFIPVRQLISFPLKYIFTI